MRILNHFLLFSFAVLPIGSWSWIPIATTLKSRSSATTTAISSSPAPLRDSDQPVLVVGATGRVGRLVVEQLLEQGVPVRALARNKTKALSLYGSSTPKLTIVEADIAEYEKFDKVLDEAVEGCSAIISVMGAVRFASLTDFLPWRLFNIDVTSWAGRDHPYYGNYLGQVRLIQLAEKHGVQRFVRLTGLGLAYSAFNPFSLLFNTLLSLNNRWGVLCEQALANSKVPYVVLRPGGLAEDQRNVTSTNVQVEPSGKLPFPGRIGRADVAALAVAALSIPPEKSYTLACRWCGEGIKPKAQGVKGDGFPTAQQCIEALVASPATKAPPPEMKPYGLAVALVVYSLSIVFIKLALELWNLATSVVWG